MMLQKSATVLLIPLLWLTIVAGARTNFAQDNVPQLKSPQHDETKEPAIRYTLEIDGKLIDLTAGKSLQIEGEFLNPKLKLTAHPYRQFSASGVQFEYPNHFTFLYDAEDVELKNWSMDSSELTIMFFVINEATSADEFTEGLVSEFGAENCTVAPAPPFKFKGDELAGTTVKTNLLGTLLVSDVYVISTEGEQTRLLVLQDILDDDGNRYPSSQDAIKQLRKTFKADATGKLSPKDF